METQLCPQTSTWIVEIFRALHWAEGFTQDKAQRLYVLGIREGRITGRIRQTTLIPTESMTADALTKPMQSQELLQFLTTGMVTIYGVAMGSQSPGDQSHLPPLQDYDEQTLMMDDKKLLDYVKGESSGCQSLTRNGALRPDGRLYIEQDGIYGQCTGH